jgi:hypothetical protein
MRARDPPEAKCKRDTPTEVSEWWLSMGEESLGQSSPSSCKRVPPKGLKEEARDSPVTDWEQEGEELTAH